MAMDKCDHCLTKEDLSCIERMAGYNLPDNLKAYLLGNYGRGSDYQQFHRWTEKAKIYCDGECEDCWVCSYKAASLLDQVFRIITCYEEGRFDIEEHNYQDAAKELAFKWADHCDSDYIPF